MTDFLTDYGVVIALVCAGAAVLYGALVTQRLLACSPGNERMQEISAAVQEGAKAYLNRQYMIIARSSPWSSRSSLIALQDIQTGDRLRDRRRPLGRRGLHRHERLGARRTHASPRRPAAASRRRSTPPSRAARSPACSSSASRCSASPATSAS